MPDELSPEDREQLVEIKFGQILDKLWDKKFDESFEKKVATRQTVRRGRGGVQTETETETSAPPDRKYSLFEMLMRS